MRQSVSAVVLLLLTLASTQHASATSTTPQERVVLVKKTVTLVRTGKLVSDQPHRKKAIVKYPVIKSGIKDPVALSRVRSLLDVKNVFGSSLQEYRQDTWLSEFDYVVNYNKNSVLDITFTQEGSGAYPDTQTKHLAINLKTGKAFKTTDVFKFDTLKQLAELVNKSLQAEMKETLDQVNKDKSIDAEEKANVPELYKDLKFQVKDLNDFMIGDEGITFLYDAEFPHVVQAYQPVGRYKFSYTELAPYLKQKNPPADLTK